MHRRTFQKFWAWSDASVAYGYLHGELRTTFGWRLKVTDATTERTLRNFPMQGNGAEMMRLACCFATERGVKVCCPIHDALLIEAPTSEIDDAVAITRSAMAQASALVLDGFILRTEQNVFGPGEPFPKQKNMQLWARLRGHLRAGNQTGDLDKSPDFPVPAMSNSHLFGELKGVRSCQV